MALRRVLGPGDSLLTPGAAIWTIEHLDELEKHFIGQPDVTKDKRFLEKLHDQVAPASPAAVQLMAELRCALPHHLERGDIRGEEAQ